MESGLPVQTGKRLINVRTTPDGVTVQFEDGSLANGDLLIGTDGIHSRIRTLLNALLGGLSHDVPTYLVSTLFFGVEVALVSGTYESIVYDTLLEQTGQSHAFEKRLGQVKLLNSLALIISSLAGGIVATVLSPRLAYFATIPLVTISLGALLTFKEPHLHHAEGRTSLKSHLLAISQTIFQPGKTLRIVTVLLATSLLLSVIFEFGPLWQLALAAPVGLYGLANAAVLSAGGVGSWLSVRRMLSKPATIVGVAGLLMVSSLALVIVKHAVVVILAQGVLVAGGVGVSMVFTRLLHDSLSSRVRAGAASPARATMKAINAAPNPTSTTLTPTAFDGLFLD